MTAPIKNIDQVYRKVTSRKSSLKRIFVDIGILAGEVFCLLLIIGIAFFVLQCGVDRVGPGPLFGAGVQREIIAQGAVVQLNREREKWPELNR